MSNLTDFSPIQLAYQDAKSIVVFIHPQSTYDAVAAATSFALTLQKAGKSCSVVCEAPMRPEYGKLAGVQMVKQTVGNRDLIVSFSYSEEQVDKVSYNVDEVTGRFELVISPKSGGQTLDPQTVEFRQAGMAADMVFLFGYHSFAELGAFYENEKYIFDNAYTVAVTQGKIASFAKFHVALQPEQLSYSEWMFSVLRLLQIGELSAEVATNILSGVEYATDRFQNIMNARTFETIAQLMRVGGQRWMDNPAMQYLATPIREVAQSAQTMPSGGLGNQVNSWSAPTFASGQGTVKAQEPKHVSAGNFAQAMGQRS